MGKNQCHQRGAMLQVRTLVKVKSAFGLEGDVNIKVEREVGIAVGVEVQVQIKGRVEVKGGSVRVQVENCRPSSSPRSSTEWKF